jgi:vacuolar protein sorting-associated protein 11
MSRQWVHLLLDLGTGSDHTMLPQLYRLTEATMSAKLDMFYAKASYSLAVSVAISQGLDEATIAEIHRRYGDQYYNAGDHEGAMNQYIQTIGSLQPSYVIRKVWASPSHLLLC